MKNVILKYAVTYIMLLFIMVLLKPVFLAVYPGDANLTDAFAVMAHGFSMDMAMAGYLTVIPALLLILSQWMSEKVTERCFKVYFIFVSVILAVISVTDLVLYGYWGFRLDMTPVFYFTTSPSAAFASASLWEMILGPIVVIVTAIIIYYLLKVTAGRIKVFPGGTRKRTVTAILLTALLFIPIRGGFTVSTMNLSRAYYSSDQHLNHAAINPVFSLLYSAAHQGNQSKHYTYMSSEEAQQALVALDSLTASPTDTVALTMLKVERPNVVMVILESFSSHLFPSLGGEPIAMKLDSIAKEGWLWTDFYANSFRTDRALTAIMSGFPGVPTTSLMKDVEKIEKTPAWPRQMMRSGWVGSYYYGGDSNFTNMHAYLVSQGFSTIVSDHSFPASERLSKWGAHDDKVFTRALRDVVSRPQGDDIFLDIIQTSSSHEPFKVPYSNRRFSHDERLNAFAYTDSCAAAFIDALRDTPKWENTLVILVPDHYGVYPTDLEVTSMRHKIPLIFTGGALSNPARTVDVTGSQADIAATLLAALGLDHSMFPFSRNLLSAHIPQYAYVNEPSIAGVISKEGEYVYNIEADAAVEQTSGKDSEILARGAHAILQSLYKYLSEL